MFYASAYADATATGEYGLVFMDLGTGDAYEPDNTNNTAGMLPLNGAQAHTLHWADDINYVTFTGAARHVYSIQAASYTGMFNLDFLDTNGTTILQSESAMFEDLYFEYLLENAGMYFLRVYAMSGETGSYEFQVNDLGEALGDAYEIDDTMERASNILVNAGQARSIHWSGDRDYIQFTNTAYHLYAMDVTHVADSLDAVLELLDAETNILASSDIGGAGEDESVTQMLFQAGTYFVHVRNYSGETGTYEVAVMDIGAIVADSYEPDNVYTQATELMVDAAETNRTLHTTNDVDFVWVTLQAQRYYVFETRNLEYNLDTFLTLLDTNGTSVLATDDTSGPQGGSRIEYFIETPGVYYLKVEPLNQSSAGNYALLTTDTRIRRKWYLGFAADVYTPPALADDGTIFVGAANSRLYGLALDGTTSRVWQLPGRVYCTPTIGLDGSVYVMASNRVFSFDPATGGTNWVHTNEFDGITRSSLALGANGLLYAPMFDYRMRALDAATGATQWFFNTTAGALM
ncbi:MAG: PQQ-binding-like beta-propeller repeat protein, partial [Lentisphaerota bacterium]